MQQHVSVPAATALSTACLDNTRQARSALALRAARRNSTARSTSAICSGVALSGGGRDKGHNDAGFASTGGACASSDQGAAAQVAGCGRASTVCASTVLVWRLRRLKSSATATQSEQARNAAATAIPTADAADSAALSIEGTAPLPAVSSTQALEFSARISPDGQGSSDLDADAV